LRASRHQHSTGAPTSFTQVVFDTIDDDDAHCIGGRPAATTTIFVHGSIREGRTTETKAALSAGIRDLIASTAAIPVEEIWVYLVELVPQQMIEFGHPLPEHGHEEEWMNALPEALRSRLDAFR
jgi:phenylpyruvate tautomerase PptA (4-oxalocrotonate tautomerase family)